MRYIFSILLVFVSIGACGGNGGGSSTISNVLSNSGAGGTEVINGIPVPPDPGPTRDATVAGVDSLGVGVRDEVQRKLAILYGNDPVAYPLALKLAKTAQSYLTTGATNQADSLAVITNDTDAAMCAYSVLSKAYPNYGITEFIHKTAILTYDTTERKQTFYHVLQSAGQIVLTVKRGADLCR